MGQKYPLPITAAMLASANSNADKPRYSTMADWAGGVKGDDVDTATATVALANSSGGAAEANYTPRTQAQKATLPGAPPESVPIDPGEVHPDYVLAVDVARPRGAIAANQPYPKSGDAAPAAPVVSSLAPATAAAGSNPLTVTITGTGFTPWSKVFTGAQTVPEQFRYVSATSLMIMIDPRAAVAGTASVAVEDHDVMSNTNINFTFS
jgi:hypothetical protein